MSVTSVVSVFMAAALVVPTMPDAEHDDCEVVTNCVFDASRLDGRVFSIRIELDATPSNGVEVVFGSDVDGDGSLSRMEEAMAVGFDCGEWKVIECSTGEETLCAGASGHAVLDWKLSLDTCRMPHFLEATANGQQVFVPLRQSPPRFLFDPGWNAAKIIRRGLPDPNLHIACSIDCDPIVLFIR